MSKKFSIVEKLNVDELTKQIRIYQSLKDTKVTAGEDSIECDPYIFINRETFDQIKASNYDELLRNCNDEKMFLKQKYTNGLVGYFDGCKVFEDNTLGFGEVELR